MSLTYNRFFYYTDSDHIDADILRYMLLRHTPVLGSTLWYNCSDIDLWCLTYYKQCTMYEFMADKELKFFRSRMLNQRVMCIGYKNKVHVWRSIY